MTIMGIPKSPITSRTFSKPFGRWGKGMETRGQWTLLLMLAIFISLAFLIGLMGHS